MTGKVQFEGDVVSVERNQTMAVHGGRREEGSVVERNLRLKRT